MPQDHCDRYVACSVGRVFEATRLQPAPDRFEDGPCVTLSRPCGNQSRFPRSRRYGILGKSRRLERQTKAPLGVEESDTEFTIFRQS